MTENGLISIVIPVYNGESYLPRCIESVLSQSYKNLEIIIVNDGSTDKSPYICDGYGKRDKRIKVIHRKNAGPGAARGEGVRVATGDYIAFVDADDFIDKNMYKHLRREAKDGIDIIQCGFRKVSTTGEVLETNELEPIDISGTFECAYYYASQKNTTNFLWNKLYKADLFKKVIFPKLYAGEDSCILTQLYASAKRVINISEPLYNYVMTPDSLCRQPFSEKKLDNIQAGRFMYEFYEEYFPELKGFSAIHICSTAAKLYCEMTLLKSYKKEDTMNHLIQDFNKYYNLSKDSMARKNTSKKSAYFIELFKISPRISTLIYKFFD